MFGMTVSERKVHSVLMPNRWIVLPLPSSNEDREIAVINADRMFINKDQCFRRWRVLDIIVLSIDGIGRSVDFRIPVHLAANGVTPDSGELLAVDAGGALIGGAMIYFD